MLNPLPLVALPHLLCRAAIIASGSEPYTTATPLEPSSLDGGCKGTGLCVVAGG